MIDALKVRELGPSARGHLVGYFKLDCNPDDDLSPQLRHLLTVDLVLALLRGGYLPEAEALAGVPIQYGRPAIARPLPVEEPTKGPDDRIIRSVAPNPRLPTTPAFQRYKAFRPGRTIAQCLSRGVTRRDLREALRAGWVLI